MSLLITNQNYYLTLQNLFTMKILNKIVFKGVPLIFIFCGFYTVVFCQEYRTDWQSLDKRSVPEWYKDAKFGIFIVWGVYSVPAYSTVGQYAEWYQHWLLSNPNGANLFLLMLPLKIKNIIWVFRLAFGLILTVQNPK